MRAAILRAGPAQATRHTATRAPDRHRAVVFDVLYLDGVDVTARPYLQRRALLQGLGLDGQPIITSPSWSGADISAAAMLDVIGQIGLEGLVAKKADSRYQPGRRSQAWIKCPSVGV